MAETIRVRKIASGEEKALWDIYYGAIHHVCVKDYSAAQISAWAPVNFDQSVWAECVIELDPWVATINSVAVGYADLQNDGLIDHFFVHHQYQRCGVGQALMDTVLTCAKEAGMIRLFSHVSRTARPFYERNGFTVICENEPVIRGVALMNTTMEKKIA